MRHSTGNPTKAQERRFHEFQRIGCYPCTKRGAYCVPEVHHIVEGNRRLGHDFTLPWCPWHHRGVGPDIREMRASLGPSFAREPRKFRDEFGTERVQLTAVNQIIAKPDPWRLACI